MHEIKAKAAEICCVVVVDDKFLMKAAKQILFVIVSHRAAYL